MIAAQTDGAAGQAISSRVGLRFDDPIRESPKGWREVRDDVGRVA
jgi:hypothetical protein